MRYLMAPFVGAFLFLAGCASEPLIPFQMSEAGINPPMTDAPAPARVIKKPSHKKAAPFPMPKPRTVAVPPQRVDVPSLPELPPQIELPAKLPAVTVSKPVLHSAPGLWDRFRRLVPGIVIVLGALLIIGLVATDFIRGFRAAAKGQA